MEPLERKNLEHIIQEYSKHVDVLTKYYDKGFLTIEEALNHVGDEVEKMEAELTRK